MEKESVRGREALISAMVLKSKRYDFSELDKEFKSLREELSENRKVLKDEMSSSAQKLDEIFGSMLSSAEEAEDLFKYVEARAHEFDLDETTKSSGHWSLLLFASKLVHVAWSTVNIFTTKRNSIFFSWENYVREIRYSSCALLTVTSYLNICKQAMIRSQGKSLFLYEPYSCKELLNEFGKFNQFVLYGRFNALQLSESLGRVVRFISRILNAYSEIYYKDGRFLTALWRCKRLNTYRVELSALKVLMVESQSAMRSVVISQYASPSFFKAFMALTETGLLAFVARCHDAIRLPVSVNKLMLLQPSPLTVKTTKGNSAAIPVPTAHIGPSPLPVRLLSKTRRSGMEEDNPVGQPPSDELVIHFHGGGFIGQTSKSHEGYLRSWARKLDCSVASVDYSLAPEIPYPRPLEEAFFAYCYALKYPEKFGWTGKKIVLAGDSAGGSLITGILIKCIQFDMRLPDGAVMLYTPFVVEAPITSPGRLLALLDPVISIGFLVSSCKSYLNKTDLLKRYEDHEEKLKVDVSYLKDLMDESSIADQSQLYSPDTDRTDNDLEQQMKRDAFNPVPFCLDDFHNSLQDQHLSPLLASENVLRKFPPISLVTCEYDPFIDDNVEMAKRLTSLGVQTELKVLEGLNHAFLNLTMLSGAARKGSAECCQIIAEHLRRT